MLWDLRRNPELAQVIELRLYAEELTLEQIEIIKEWLDTGRGLIIYVSDNNYERPFVRSNRILNIVTGQQYTLERVDESDFFALDANNQHPVQRYAQRIKCGYSRGHGEYKVSYAVQKDKNLTFESLFETEDSKTVVAAWVLPSGGRVIYLGCDIHYSFKKYKDQYDTQRFWANTILWLAHEN